MNKEKINYTWRKKTKNINNKYFTRKKLNS